MNRRMHRKLTLAALALGFALATGATRAEGLVPHAADYKVKISLLSGKLTSRVYDIGDGFKARSVIVPTGFASLLKDGSIVEESEFRLRPEGIRPQRYQSIDTLSSDPKTMAFDFDWEEQAVTGDINEESFRFEFEGAVHDRVSIQYALMLNLLNGDDTDEYSLLDGDELKELTVRNIGTRKVRVPFGRFEAVGIQHQAQDSSRVSTLWCVRELGFLPVVIEQHRDGKLRVRAELTDYRPVPTATAVNR